MTESNRENLSCLMDGELDRDAQVFLLRRLAGDPDMTATWRRYHLVRSCMHAEMASGQCIAERVSEAIANEDVPTRESALPSWMRPVAGAAIAAGVALFAIVGINSILLQQGQPDSVVEQPGFVSQPTSLDRTFSQQAVPVGFNEVSPADRQRINTYVLRHNQAVGGSGFISYVPIVTGTPTGGTQVETGDSDQERSDLE
jgi:sigma-E factor negative regulatory protein RseA